MFNENLRLLRLGRFLSQAELARRAGLHALTITRLEAGASAPATRTVRVLAEVLGVQPRELATPHEVAELRRVLGRSPPSRDKAADGTDNENTSGAAAEQAVGGKQAD